MGQIGEEEAIMLYAMIRRFSIPVIKHFSVALAVSSLFLLDPIFNRYFVNEYIPATVLVIILYFIFKKVLIRLTKAQVKAPPFYKPSSRSTDSN